MAPIFWHWLRNYLSGSRRFSPPFSRAVCRTQHEDSRNCSVCCSSDVRCIAPRCTMILLIRMLHNDTADEDDGDDDTRTRCRCKRRQSATRRAPRIDVSEQTDDASRNVADGVAAACRRSPALSDARAAPGKRCWGCTAANRRSRWCNRPMRPPGDGDGDA